MGLEIGSKLGPYEIETAVGAGGMGEVYRARDTRLDRTVAVKVLPAHLASDPALRQRFEREARAISSLNHPNICTLHDVGRQNGVDFLVMEFLEGETLEKRLEKGALPVKQVLEYGVQIAEALDRAHRQGIVHRDLKPGNVMLTRSGAKLMDFGLAKPPALPAGLLSGTDSPTSPSASKPLTQEGTIVGTYQYMAPEQIQGREADARTDIFALGVLLYEMATGQRPFAGKTTLSVMSGILEREPEPLNKLQPMAPSHLEHVVLRALEKDPDQRWQSAADVRAELKWVMDQGSQAARSMTAMPGRAMRAKLAWMLAAAATLVAVAFAALYFQSAKQSMPVIRSFLPPPDRSTYVLSTGDDAGPPAISSDGTRLAFTARGANGIPMIWVRQLDQLEPRPLPGTERGWFPFWSPDGRSLGFFSDGQLRTVSLEGGSPVALAPATNGRGGSWGRDGAIIFSPVFRGTISRVAATGGTAVPITTMNTSLHSSHRWPVLLPDGRHFLYLALNHLSPQHESDAVYYASLDGKENRLLLRTFRNAEYASGHLLFARDGHLFAQPFDPDKGVLSGEPRPVADDVAEDPGTWHAVFTVSQNGVLAYNSSGDHTESGLGLYDRSGKLVTRIEQKLQNLTGVRVSPKGDRVALLLDTGVADIWVYDIARKTMVRITFGPDSGTNPSWSPDGKWIAYSSFRKGWYNLYRKHSDGSGAEETLAESEEIKFLADWSRDGRYLLYVVRGRGGQTEIWTLPVEGERKPRMVVGGLSLGAFVTPCFSPDGRWVAYSSAESGKPEIYVVPFNGGNSKWQVSSGGAVAPYWPMGGKELLYVSSDNHIVSVPVTASRDTLQFGAPRALFLATGNLSQEFDVTADGQRFLFNTVSESGSHPITLVTNWPAARTK
jgi:Tol biopolymer transport system component/predicted Ser/Thr protein kinase